MVVIVIVMVPSGSFKCQVKTTEQGARRKFSAEQQAGPHQVQLHRAGDGQFSQGLKQELRTLGQHRRQPEHRSTVEGGLHTEGLAVVLNGIEGCRGNQIFWPKKTGGSPASKS